MPKTLSTEDIAEFRDRLCDAAEQLFGEHGLEAVTMRQLAGELGVSPMTPYRYFKDKDAILAAVRARAFDRHGASLEAAYADAEGRDSTERARLVGDAYMTFALENPNSYRLMFDVRQPSAMQYPDLIRAMNRSRATMTRHLNLLAEEGRLNGDPDLIGHMFWSAIHGPIMLELSGLLIGSFGARELAGRVMEALDAQLIGSNRT